MSQQETEIWKDIAGWEGFYQNNTPTDNRVENLEWCTPKENMAHCIKSNRFEPPKGEKCGTSILKTADVLEIRKQKGIGAFDKDLASQFNVTIGCIKGVTSRRNWKHI